MVKPTHRKHLAYHDYRERCIYHITLVCSERKKLLGRVVGDSVDEARCELTPLGVEVAKAIQGIPGCAAGGVMMCRCWLRCACRSMCILCCM